VYRPTTGARSRTSARFRIRKRLIYLHRRTHSWTSWMFLFCRVCSECAPRWSPSERRVQHGARLRLDAPASVSLIFPWLIRAHAALAHAAAHAPRALLGHAAPHSHAIHSQAPCRNKHPTAYQRGPQCCSEVRHLSRARSTRSSDVSAALATGHDGSAQGAHGQWQHVELRRASTRRARGRAAWVWASTVRKKDRKTMPAAAQQHR